MPSPRFMRLSAEKQAAIWEAAVQEFLDKPYEKVSINKIIKQAGISRGSFYTYFVDKRDLLVFILWGSRQQWYQFCIESVRESQGDFFAVMSRLLEETIEFCRNNHVFNLHKNLIMYPEPILEHLPGPRDCEREINDTLLSKIDRRKFRDPSDAGVTAVAKIAAMILFSTLAEFCRKPEQEELLKANFEELLDVLKRGAYRCPEKTGMGGE